MAESKQDALELARKRIAILEARKKMGEGGSADDEEIILAQAVIDMQERIFNLEGDVMQEEGAMGMVFEQVKRAGIANPQPDGSYIQTQKMAKLAMDKLELAEAQVTALRSDLEGYCLVPEIDPDGDPTGWVRCGLCDEEGSRQHPLTHEQDCALSATPPAVPDFDYDEGKAGDRGEAEFNPHAPKYHAPQNAVELARHIIDLTEDPLVRRVCQAVLDMQKAAEADASFMKLAAKTIEIATTERDGLKAKVTALRTALETGRWFAEYVVEKCSVFFAQKGLDEINAALSATPLAVPDTRPTREDLALIAETIIELTDEESVVLNFQMIKAQKKHDKTLGGTVPDTTKSGDSDGDVD